ncbi:ATP-dependent DNA helicase RecG [SAR202 cluster bacterium AD-804-J14_MRT_500m]|nr:ATP-dependent DNA helicase RecG [SAR202 cluster bacterium AD-804-J14_MRT_500m]
MTPRTNRLSLDSFENILKLEKAHHYGNTAVIGGLDKFIHRWSPELKELFQQQPETQALLSCSYDGLSSAKREVLVKRWLRLLANTVSKTPHTTDLIKTKKPPPNPKVCISIDAPVTDLKGVDAKTAIKLRRLDVSSIRDLLYIFPKRHNDYSQQSKVSDLMPGSEASIIVNVWEARQIRMGRKGSLRATEAVVGDETGNLRVIWFGQTYLARQLTSGTQVALSGKVGLFRRERVLESPDYEILGSDNPIIHAARLVPIYPLTEGLTARTMRRLNWQSLDRYGSCIEEFLPDEFRQQLTLPTLRSAIFQAHFPDDLASWETARRRLAFDELLLLQIAVQRRRQAWQQDSHGLPIKVDQQVLTKFRDRLPFSFTNAQERCLIETLTDMERGSPAMSRLLQGEVGSGKTVVALAALLAAVVDGFQGSIMVPTEVLAEQHFKTIANLMGEFSKPVQQNNLITAYIDHYAHPISIGLVTGSTRKSFRGEIQSRAADGTLDILIGTQALIQQEMKMPNLGLAVVDEQHRFGVMQRAALRGKGNSIPHMLIMSATPIPRTLAHTLFGDLDISILDELPPGRQKIITRWVPPEKRIAAYEFVRDQVQTGRQAFVICPLIEESDSIEAKAATEEFDRLSSEVFPDLKLGLLHGKLSAKAKETVMSQFSAGELDILISTPVVEVGIDIPNASVMMIEAADRFGLAQLHQFRGRVGRGNHKSYCLLLSESPSKLAQERLSAVERIHDGFKLAEVDLSLRGPGDLFGTRQSGLPALRMARLTDIDLLNQARETANAIIMNDPNLTNLEHRHLAKEIARFMAKVSSDET